MSNVTHSYIEVKNPYVPPIENETISTPTLLNVADNSETVEEIKGKYYGILANLQYFIDDKSDELKSKQRKLTKDRGNSGLELEVTNLEEQVDVLIAHRKAVSCCSSWGINLINTNNPELKYRMPIPCRRLFCPNCSQLGSAPHIVRCQKGWELVKECEESSVGIGHFVFTTPPEVREGLLTKENIKLIQGEVTRITKKYVGCAGVMLSQHMFGELNENGYAKFSPHFNLIFPLANKDGNDLGSYKLSQLELCQMKIEYAEALTSITGIELKNPVKQNTREEELTIYYRWFTWDGNEWMGMDKDSNLTPHNMYHLIYYDFRSTIDPKNLIMQDDNVKEFVYFEMFGFHLVKGYGSLSNSLRSKYLKKLNPCYEKKEKIPFRCLVDDSVLKAKKLHGSNRVEISNIREDPEIISIEEYVEEMNTTFYANENVIVSILLNKAGVIAFYATVGITKIYELMINMININYLSKKHKVNQFLNERKH